MKRWSYFIIIAAVLGVGGFMLLKKGSYKPHMTYQPQAPAPSTTITDPATVFQKALWKRPNSSDRIHHAERREWKDADAVSRWQWFLEVEPSPEIVRYLRDENAFGLKSRPTAELLPDAPTWFIRDTRDARILSAPGGGMQLIFTAGDARLFAMGSGGGFRPGAPEKPPALAQIPAAGRLPLESPPSRAKP